MAQQGKEIPEEIWKKFIEELKENFVSITHTCIKLGIERRSYYYKRLKDPDFASEVDLLFERVQVPIAEEMLRAEVMRCRPWAVRFTLERASKKWSSKFTNEYLDGQEYRIAKAEGRVKELPYSEEEHGRDTPAY